MKADLAETLAAIAAAMLVAACPAACAPGWGDEIPVGSTFTDGNSASLVPFGRPQGATNLRYQQVFGANNFVAPGNAGGVWLDRIAFRVDTTSGFSHSDTLTDVQVNLSTTQQGPDSLSLVFADNVGADDMQVYGRGPVQFIGFWGPGPGPQSFGFALTLSQPFFYVPANGDLLLDIRIFQGNTSPFAPPPLDAWDRPTDAVSSLWADSVAASSGTLSTVGLVARFEGQLVPEPSAVLLGMVGAATWGLLGVRRRRSARRTDVTR